MDNTVHLISNLYYLMKQFIVSELGKKGITEVVPSHGDIIASLLNNDSLTMHELAVKIDKDPSTVTTLVKKLNALGYTKVQKDTQDKRATRVSLTLKGKELKIAFLNISASIFKKQYQNIDDSEIDIFRKVIEKMIVNFTTKEVPEKF